MQPQEKPSERETRREIREHLINQDICPECRGEFDTGWECNDCGFDGMAELKASPAWEATNDH